MQEKSKIKFDFDDILLTPIVKTKIRSRYNDIDNLVRENTRKGFQFTEFPHYPIMTAPMTSVISAVNKNRFYNNKIVSCLPRVEDRWLDMRWDNGFSYKNNFMFISLTLSQAEMILNNNGYSPYGSPRANDCVLIDVANGHMKSIFSVAKRWKNKYPDNFLMIGNVANPETYREYVEHGYVDAVRLGIGNGAGCLTTQQTAIGYPIASLIHETFQIKKEYGENAPLIIADGGFKNYSDIIKGIALGADYVMLGSVFNKAIESTGDNYWRGIKINQEIAEVLFKKGFKIKKKFYGMSTKIAQNELGIKSFKTSEGVVRYQTVEYSLKSWISNFDHYLRSAMSYAGATNLKEFREKSEFIQITTNALNRFKK